MIARLLRTLSQRFVEADLSEQRFACPPSPFLHLSLWVQPVHPSCHMQHLAEVCLSLAVDAKPGSLSRVESGGQLFPRLARPTDCLPARLAD